MGDANGDEGGAGACRLSLRQPIGWPSRGLLFIQIDGPWTQPGVPVRAAYRHTHWVSVHARHVYDINAGEAGGWLPREEWERTVMLDVWSATKRATGWHVRLGIEVLR